MSYHKVNQVVARVVYANVKDIAANSSWMVVHDLDNDRELEINSADLVDSFANGTAYSRTEDATKTRLAELLINAAWRPFTVEFIKADGSLRVLTGVFISQEALLGRSLVRDLRLPKGDQLRLVDHRNIQSIIINDVRYVLKEETIFGRKATRRDRLGRFIA